MNTELKETGKNPDAFFSILPDEWKEDLVPAWSDISQDCSIYTLENENVIIAGGILFSTCPPDLQYFRENAEKWFKSGYLYIGYLWVIPEYRGKSFGSLWIEKLKSVLPKQKFWLVIEDEKLQYFYKQNGFKTAGTITIKNQEWILYYEPV